MKLLYDALSCISTMLNKKLLNFLGSILRESFEAVVFPAERIEHRAEGFRPAAFAAKNVFKGFVQELNISKLITHRAVELI